MIINTCFFVNKKTVCRGWGSRGRGFCFVWVGKFLNLEPFRCIFRAFFKSIFCHLLDVVLWIKRQYWDCNKDKVCRGWGSRGRGVPMGMQIFDLLRCIFRALIKSILCHVLTLFTYIYILDITLQFFKISQHFQAQLRQDKLTLLYNFDFTKNFVSLTLKIDFFVICVFLRNTNISHYFWRKPQISPQRSRDTKKVHLSKVVDHGRFRGDANWNFWKIFKNEKVMSKKRNINFDIRQIVSVPVKKIFMVTKLRKSNSAWKTGL